MDEGYGYGKAPSRQHWTGTGTEAGGGACNDTYIPGGGQGWSVGETHPGFPPDNRPYGFAPDGDMRWAEHAG